MTQRSNPQRKPSLQAGLFRILGQSSESIRFVASAIKIVKRARSTARPTPTSMKARRRKALAIAKKARNLAKALHSIDGDGLIWYRFQEERERSISIAHSEAAAGRTWGNLNLLDKHFEYPIQTLQLLAFEASEVAANLKGSSGPHQMRGRNVLIAELLALYEECFGFKVVGRRRDNATRAIGLVLTQAGFSSQDWRDAIAAGARARDSKQAGVRSMRFVPGIPLRSVEFLGIKSGKN